jgi:hypothetical protein
MRPCLLRVAKCGLAAPVLSAPTSAFAQVEKILVTAQRRKTKLQDMLLPPKPRACASSGSGLASKESAVPSPEQKLGLRTGGNGARWDAAHFLAGQE